jgi:flagellum-specific ATP synthase
MPRLLERAGRAERGSITGVYTVLVEGNDVTEPVADTARSILDGHVWLSRDLAHRGHFPAVDVLGSVSRLMRDVSPPEAVEAASRLRGLLAAHRNAEDLINVGAYVKGSNPEIDAAVKAKPAIDAFLRQAVEEKPSLEATRAALLDLARRTS